MRAETISPALARSHAESLRKMLVLERATRTRLDASVQEAIAVSGAGSTHQIVTVVAHRLEATLSRDLARVRLAARRDSRIALAVELRLAAAPFGVETLPIGAPDAPRAEDGARATRAAKAFAASWLASAIDALGEDEDPRPAMIRAANAQGYRLDTVAATEVAQAFNDEREVITDDYAEQAKLRFLPIPLKRWDATLDRATCKQCAKLDGAFRPWGFDFPDGEVPGQVHPRCRCIETTVFLPLPYQQEAA